MNAVQAGRMYDQLPPGQSISRQAFVKQAVALTDPDRFHADAQAVLNRRSTAQTEKVKIERALKQKGV